MDRYASILAASVPTNRGAVALEMWVAADNGNLKYQACSSRRTIVYHVAASVESSTRLHATTDSTVELKTETVTILKINQRIRECDSIQAALSILEELKKDGVLTANQGTYQALITVCKRLRQGERALTVFQAMKQAGIEPNLRTYSILISCCLQALRLEDGFKIKEEMEGRGIIPDTVTYTSLIDLAIRAEPYRGRSTHAERLEKAMSLFNEMRSRSIQPDTRTFNALLVGAADAKLPDKILELYQVLLDSGLSANQFTYEVIMKCLGSGGRIKAALQVYNEIQAAGVVPRTSTFNFLIEGCAVGPQPNAKKAWEIFEEMTSAAVSPDADTFINLIAASYKGGDNQGALRAFQSMKKLGFGKKITSSQYNQLIQAEIKSGNFTSALQVFEEMKESGQKPDIITFGILVSACIRNKDGIKAQKIRQEFEDSGLKANQIYYHTLVGAYGEVGDLQEAINSFDKLLKENMASIVSYNILFDACLGKTGNRLTLDKNKRLQITPGIHTAIEFYDKAVSKNLFSNYTKEKLTRCDVREMSRSGIVVALLSWLKQIQKNVPTTDLIIITGNYKERREPDQQTQRLSAKHRIAQKTLQFVGLPSKQLDTLSMQTLKVKSSDVKSWISKSFSFDSVTKDIDAIPPLEDTVQSSEIPPLEDTVQSSVEEAIAPENAISALKS